MIDDDSLEDIEPPEYVALREYDDRVAALVAEDRPRVLGVQCADCSGRARPLGAVVDSPDGPLLVVREDPPTYGTAGRIPPAEVRAITGQRAGGRPRGWLLAPRPADLPPAWDDDLPAIVCPTHGRILVDVGALTAAVRSGARVVAVGADGRTTSV